MGGCRLCSAITDRSGGNRRPVEQSGRDISINFTEMKMYVVVPGNGMTIGKDGMGTVSPIVFVSQAL